MTYRAKALSQQEIQEHLNRADELGVSLKEYALAYDVNLNTLANAKSSRKKPSPSEFAPEDFVKVDIEAIPTGSSLCTLTLAGGCSLECYEWPPAHWLQTLVGARR